MSANPSGTPSAVETIGIAFDRTRRILFEPFDASKWFALGFCAFLSALGESGGFNYRFPAGNGGGLPPDVWNWIGANRALAIAIVAAIALLVLAMWVVLCWLSSRGKFMFLDGVVRDRGAVVDPWKRFADLAWRLFTFRILLGAIALVVVGGVAAVGAALVWPTFRAVTQGALPPARLILVFAIAGSLAFLVVIPFLVIHVLLNLFFVPIMWVHEIGVGDAWAEFRRRLMPEIGSVVVFVVLYFVLSIGAAVVMIAATCLTCCLAAIPYLGTVILLPIPVFFRCWSVEFLAALGGPYTKLKGAVDVGGTFD